MASIVDYEETSTYHTLPVELRNEWLTKVNSYPPGMTAKPVDGEVF